MSSSYSSAFVVFSLMGAAGVAIYVALYGSHRVVEERFNDLAVKIRASQGTFDDDQPQDESLSRMLFNWAAARVPAPDPTLRRAKNYPRPCSRPAILGGGMAHAFQVFRVLICDRTGDS